MSRAAIAAQLVVYAQLEQHSNNQREQLNPPMNENQELMIQTVACKTVHAGAMTSLSCGLFRWISENPEFLTGLGIIIGILVSILGLIINLYYKHKADMREQRAEQREIERSMGVDHREGTISCSPLHRHTKSPRAHS